MVSRIEPPRLPVIDLSLFDLGDPWRSQVAAQIDAATDLVQNAIDPGGNVHASKEFQRHLASVLTRRALIEANERALRDN